MGNCTGIALLNKQENDHKILLSNKKLYSEDEQLLLDDIKIKFKNNNLINKRHQNISNTFSNF